MFLNIWPNIYHEIDFKIIDPLYDSESELKV